MSFITIRIDHLSIPEMRDTIIPWISKNMPGRYVYQWPQPSIVCANEEDAMVLVLKFGGKQEETKIQRMIKNEKDNN